MLIIVDVIKKKIKRQNQNAASGVNDPYREKYLEKPF